MSNASDFFPAGTKSDTFTDLGTGSAASGSPTVITLTGKKYMKIVPASASSSIYITLSDRPIGDFILSIVAPAGGWTGNLVITVSATIKNMTGGIVLNKAANGHTVVRISCNGQTAYITGLPYD